MKNNLVIPVVVIFIFIISGLITLNGDIIALSIPVIFYITVSLWFSPGKPKLDIKREISRNWVSTKCTVEVAINITNKGEKIEEFSFADPTPCGFEIIDGTNKILTSLSPEENVILRYSLRAKRGTHSITHAHICVSDNFGLFKTNFNYHLPFELYVKPPVKKYDSIPVRPPRTRGFSGPVPSRQSGSGMSFFAVREYQSGDSLRHINWKIAARHQSNLYTNVYQKDRVADIALILDSRSIVNSNSENESAFEHSVEATASLATSLLNDTHRVSLIVYGDSMRNVYPGYGKIQNENILKALSEAKPGFNYALNNLGYLPTRLIPPRSQIIFISPLVSNDIQVLSMLKMRGYAVMLICPNMIDFEVKSKKTKSNSVKDIHLKQATKLAGLQRAFRLKKAKRAGIVVIDWKTSESLPDKIKQTLKTNFANPYFGGKR
ncbi:DUF58 domain-containing protein [Chitinispirillales bacterium ANBcel5]|uniref:DUF58 domain-containing protein n=1 Tax=Cellulosispirillum alkaliphilum TaxID=3039283 RepID=UPI002A4F8406|nr:DUF58 domain-containing protein [Chitinispirillales bacterium ANBcel5]